MIDRALVEASSTVQALRAADGGRPLTRTERGPEDCVEAPEFTPTVSESRDRG